MLQTERLRTLDEVRAVIDGNQRVDFQIADRESAYDFIRRTLVRFHYLGLSKPDRGVIRRYLAKMTGLSRAQLTRLIRQYRDIRTLAYHRQHTSTTTRLHLIPAAKLCNEWGPPL